MQRLLGGELGFHIWTFLANLHVGLPSCFAGLQFSRVDSKTSRAVANLRHEVANGWTGREGLRLRTIQRTFIRYRMH